MSCSPAAPRDAAPASPRPPLAPLATARPASPASPARTLPWVISGRTEEALRAQASQLLDHVQEAASPRPDRHGLLARHHQDPLRAPRRGPGVRPASVASRTARGRGGQSGDERAARHRLARAAGLPLPWPGFPAAGHGTAPARRLPRLRPSLRRGLRRTGHAHRAPAPRDHLGSSRLARSRPARPDSVHPASPVRD